MTDTKQKKTPIASEKLDAATRVLGIHGADGRIIPSGVRQDLFTVIGLIKTENERLGAIIKQGKQSVGGMQAKINAQAQTIKGLEKRLEELEGMVGK